MNKLLKVFLLSLSNIFWIFMFLGGIGYALIFAYKSFKMVETQAKQIEMPEWLKRTKYADKTLPKVIDGRR